MCSLGITTADPHTDHYLRAILIAMLWMGRHALRRSDGVSTWAAEAVA